MLYVLQIGLLKSCYCYGSVLLAPVPDFNRTGAVSIKWLAKQDLSFCTVKKEYLDRTYAFSQDILL